MPRQKLMVFAIAQLLGLGPVAAATLAVDSTADSSADDDSCTLREAIESAMDDSRNGRTSTLNTQLPWTIES